MQNLIGIAVLKTAINHKGGSPTNRLFCGGLTTHPGETSFVTKPIRERNWTAQHGNGPQPALDQRVCINLRHRTRVATWNVQTLLRPGAATLLSRELCRYNISLAGLCEVRWHSNGEITAGDHYYFWSGPKRQTGLYGVALAISKDLRKSLISWTPLSDRLLSARFFHQHGKMTVIVAYAPTDVADEDAKDAFFDQLHQAVGLASPHDIIIILTDTNATLFISDRSTGSPVGTTFADRSTNDNAYPLLDMVQPRWQNQESARPYPYLSTLVTNCRVYRGAELGNTDHRLLVAHLKLKLRANRHTKTLPRLDSSLLSDPNIATDFSCAIRRTFDNLAKDKPWISERTLNIIDRRHEARLRSDLTEYRRLNRQRNVAIAEDREKFWQAEAKHLESAANNNNMSRVFSLLRQARNGPRIKTALVKDSDGNLTATEANCLERWKEHFSLFLQHGTSPADPTISLAANAAAPSVACSTSPVTPEEVRAALGKLNNRKSPGICAITAEMLKSGGESIVEWLTRIFNKVWETERLPSDWTRGVILPLWKRKGDRLVCGNHRGITLLSIPGKLFTRILLTHALPAIRSSRRPQQAGFMPNRSTID
ncbi:uncharacterized protein LOC124628743 [Tachysurus ichikawai]